ncbi:hypothetical protein PVAND_009696 [Polypedilum vanderplanki]|uniref:Zinc carboxypeptidase A 1 n=1 Tax=Polypedilum vanderplanki TaxID=319348 RepID=A0A9J6CEG4_POLVA|nr:hypothetical protein PVAND_009696 [Polypedilum vanderplanki]
MKIKLIFLILSFVTVNAVIEKARYDNYRVYEINIENEDHLKLMQEIENFPDGYKFMEPFGKIKSNVRLIVPPHKFGDFSELVERFELKTRLLVTNLQEVFDREQPKRTKRSTFDWSSYWDLDKIYDWLKQLTVQYPNDVTLINIGKSYENRDILGVKVNIGGGTNKKSVMFEGLHHAREWITAATVTWMLNELLTSTDNEVRELAANYEWYIFPVTNPDGYVYTWTTNRMWRKTRKPSSNLLCYGSDPNRNWDNFFNQGGTSMNPCSDTYAGEFTFSEPETRQLSEFIKTIPNLAAYFPFHSFGQYLMLPYGWTHELLENYHQLYAIGEKAIEALKAVNGRVYKFGSIANVLYIATGASIDWVKYELKTNVTFEYEMRDDYPAARDTNGFILPAEEIIPNSIEVFRSLVVILQEAKAIGIA